MKQFAKSNVESFKSVSVEICLDKNESIVFSVFIKNYGFISIKIRGRSLKLVVECSLNGIQIVQRRMRKIKKLSTIQRNHGFNLDDFNGF